MKPWLIDDTNFRMRSCTRKVNLTANRAYGIARRREMRAYHCTFCGGWHLTSQV